MKTVLAFIVVVLLAWPAAAGPIVMSGPTSWYSWSSPTGTFWGNPSYDRNGLANVGYYLAGIPGSDVPDFFNGSPDAYLAYLGTGDVTFAFTLAAGSSFSHLQSVTGWNDTVGIVDLATGVHVPLFQAWDTKGISAFVGGTFAFYLTSGEGRTWYSTSLDGDRNHFALFLGPGESWYLGIEDATWSTPRTADWDYNDFIGRIDAVPVPEAGSTFAMLALGLAAMSWLRRGK
jgi:hypothetical protein